VCEAGAKCAVGCTGGNCKATCANPADCSISCPGGSCKVN
jgi:hypothetical protein